MKVLLVNKFLHHVGGVETYFSWQAAALHDAGNDVAVVGMRPPRSAPLMPLPELPTWLTPTRSFEPGASGRARSAASSVWSFSTAGVMREALNSFRPDVVHFHGTCYQLTPSIVREVHRAQIPIVLTAHEYKLICANQVLYDDALNKMCEACVGASALRKIIAPIRRSCMKGSRAVSALGALEGRVAEATWRAADPWVLTPSRFMRDRLLMDGWPSASVQHLDLPWCRADELVLTTEEGGVRDSVVFLGRLAPIKGVHLLLRIWSDIARRHPAVRLRIVGEGAERPKLEAFVAAQGLPRVDFLGWCSKDEVRTQLNRALVTVHPSQMHENSPYSVRESLMSGVPAVVSDLGGMPELIGPSSGWVVAHDDASAWRTAIEVAISARRSRSPNLQAEVLRRAMTDEEHLRSLTSAYAARLGATTTA